MGFTRTVNEPVQKHGCSFRVALFANGVVCSVCRGGVKRVSDASSTQYLLRCPLRRRRRPSSQLSFCIALLQPQRVSS